MLTENGQTAYTEDELLAMMMDALDGTLSADELTVLESALAVHPVLAQEWQGMQAVDALLLAVPQVAPPVGFATQTLALLPNLALRRAVWLGAFGVLLVAGLLPFVLMGGLGLVLLSGGTAVLDLLSQFSLIMMRALGQLLPSLGDYLGENPAVVGTFMVMIGSIFLWTGVYRQLVGTPQMA